MDQTQKRDAGKFDPLMIEEDLARALEVCNAVLEFGKEKYGTRGGWMAVDMQRYKSADARHRRERMKYGIEERDQETGLLHIAHEIINLSFMLEMFLREYEPDSSRRFTTYNKPAFTATSLADIAEPPVRTCKLTNTSCADCPPEETCRADYRGLFAPTWVKAQIQQFDNQPDYHTAVSAALVTNRNEPSASKY